MRVMDSSEGCYVNPVRRQGEPEISGSVLLCVNPGEAKALGRYAENLGARRHFLYNSSLWSLPGPQGFLCGPAIGAPMAVMTLEKLIALGGQRFVVLGTCGALAQGVTFGDVLMPQWAVSSEGTSRHYPLSLAPRVSPRLYATVGRFLSGRGVAWQSGGVWTTDAPFRETRAQIAHYRDLAVSGVDMEFSALLTVAAFRRVELVAVMVVSDVLSGEEWRPGFGSKAFASSVRGVSQALFDFLCEGRS